MKLGVIIIIIYLQAIVLVFVFVLSRFRHCNLWPSSSVYQSSLLFLLAEIPVIAWFSEYLKRMQS